MSALSVKLKKMVNALLKLNGYVSRLAARESSANNTLHRDTSHGTSKVDQRRALCAIAKFSG